jgi:hypothetical protein
MIEKQIDGIFLLPHGHAILPAYKAESVTQLQQKRLQPGNQPVFQLALFHCSSQTQKVQAVGTLEHLVGLLRKMFWQGQRKVVGFLFLGGMLIRTGLDLIQQHAPRPAIAGRRPKIPEPGGGVFDLLQDFDMVPPRNWA